MPELGRYAVTYVAYGRGGPGVSLALTEDFRTFERIGMVLPPEDKDAALFPRRFGERWAMIHRPVPVIQHPHPERVRSRRQWSAVFQLFTRPR